jgi:RHH-type proline utilization regulon transcriptional repressor/proline dehydrogenase/delta 1-pyrroline-5-carboxylate dehydrogenase
MVGAVVGVQPFGGDGLSGTGPKAGGPLVLRRLAVAGACVSGRIGFDAGVGSALDDGASAALREALIAPLAILRDGLMGQGRAEEPVVACDTFAAKSPLGLTFVLAGPTGERNSYRLLPRQAVLCVAADEDDLLFLLAAVLASGSSAVWVDDALTRSLLAQLPAPLRQRIRLVADADAAEFDCAAILAERDAVAELSRRLARRPGAIVGLVAAPRRSRDAANWPLERLFVERTLSVNTAAAGGNAGLMTIG